MKTQKQGGKYDFVRASFKCVEDLAYFLERSTSYVQARLTGGLNFTASELRLMNEAVTFYNKTDIEPVKFKRM